MPRPNVDSAVIRLTTLEKPAVDAENTELLFHIIKTAFAQRRKTLLNCFFNCGGWDMSKEELTELINAAGYDEKVRGEALTLEDYAKITEVFENRQK